MLLWFGVETGGQGAFYALLAVLLLCIFSTGTGGSLGCRVGRIAVLYPTGVALGANPTMLAIGHHRRRRLRQQHHPDL